MLRFKSITIKNYGPYINETIEFPSKGVTVIWGNNGQGKTTILNSFKYLLFGTFPPLGDDPLCKLINKDKFNEGDYELKVSAIIDFDGVSYELTRLHTPIEKDKKPMYDADYRESFHIRDLTNGGTPLNPQQRNHLIESFLPRSVSRFYLFDAELLEEYKQIVVKPSSSQSKQIKDSIEKILGMPVLTNCDSHVSSAMEEYRIKLKRQKADDKVVQEYLAAIKFNEDRKNSIMSTLETAKNNRVAYQERFNELDRKLDHYSDATAALTNIKTLNSEIKSIDRDIDSRYAQLCDLTGDCWKDLVEDRLIAEISTLNELIDNLNDKKRQAYNSIALSTLISDSLSQHKCVLCGTDHPSEDHLKQLLKNTCEPLSSDEETTLNDAEYRKKLFNSIRFPHKVDNLSRCELDIVDLTSKKA